MEILLRIPLKSNGKFPLKSRSKSFVSKLNRRLVLLFRSEVLEVGVKFVTKFSYLDYYNYLGSLVFVRSVLPVGPLVQLVIRLERRELQIHVNFFSPPAPPPIGRRRNPELRHSTLLGHKPGFISQFGRMNRQESYRVFHLNSILLFLVVLLPVDSMWTSTPVVKNGLRISQPYYS